MRATVGAGLLCAAIAMPANAQVWRTLDASRARTDSGAVAVHVDYTRGQLRARPLDGGSMLYDLHLRYDATRSHPLIAFDSAARSLSVGTQARPDARTSTEGRNAGEAVLQLGRSGPLDLNVRLDVATATLDFGGLAIRRLSVTSAASEVRVGFDAPNSTVMDGLELDVSAASLTALGLGNANTNRLRVGARAGGAELHLDGAWLRDMQLDLDVALGSITVFVPSDVGVQLEVRKIIASVDAGGLTQSGNIYVSSNWNTARRKLRITANATAGKLRLVHDSR
jgi:hypothetical protein